MTLRIIICIAAITVLGIGTYFLVSGFLSDNIRTEEFTRGDI